MKMLSSFAAAVVITFISINSFALDSCKSIFTPQTQQEQKLSVVEIAAIYHQNYLKSEKGQAQIKRMEKLLSTKYEVRRDKDGRPYYQVVYEPKEAVKESVIEEITTTNPDITIVYDLDAKP